MSFYQWDDQETSAVILGTTFPHLFTCYLSAWVAKIGVRGTPRSPFSIQPSPAQASPLSTGLSQLCLLRPCSRAVQNVVGT